MSSVLSFDYPWVLAGFALFIPLALFDLCSPRLKRERRLLPPALLTRLRVSTLFFRIFLACGITALAGPRWGLERASGEFRRGLDAVIAVDVSRSMEIRDIPPPGQKTAGEGEYLSRLEQGLALIRETVAAVPEARFAAAIGRGRGLAAIPLTWDNDAILSLLNALDSSALTGSGTNLESLVDAAAEAFHSAFPSRRVILLVSDGEALSGSLRVALDRLNRDDIIVIAVALGSDDGRPVPWQEGAVSRRDSAAMRMAAERTGGILVDGNRNDAAAVLTAYLRSLAPEYETGGNRRERKARRFLFVMAALLAWGASKLSLLQIRSG